VLRRRTTAMCRAGQCGVRRDRLVANLAEFAGARLFRLPPRPVTKGRAKNPFRQDNPCAGRLMMEPLAAESVSSGSTEMQFDCTRAVAAAFADGGVISTRRTRVLHQARAATAGVFGGAGCTNTIARRALSVRQVCMTPSSCREMGDLDEGAAIGQRRKAGIRRDQIDYRGCLRMKLEVICARQFASTCCRRFIAVDVAFTADLVG